MYYISNSHRSPIFSDGEKEQKHHSSLKLHVFSSRFHATTSRDSSRTFDAAVQQQNELIPLSHTDHNFSNMKLHFPSQVLQIFRFVLGILLWSPKNKSKMVVGAETIRVQVRTSLIIPACVHYCVL